MDESAHDREPCYGCEDGLECEEPSNVSSRNAEERQDDAEVDEVADHHLSRDIGCF